MILPQQLGQPVRRHAAGSTSTRNPHTPHVQNVGNVAASFE
jgi:hypothetical protein